MSEELGKDEIGGTNQIFASAQYYFPILICTRKEGSKKPGKRLYKVKFERHYITRRKIGIIYREPSTNSLETMTGYPHSPRLHTSLWNCTCNISNTFFYRNCSNCYHTSNITTISLLKPYKYIRYSNSLTDETSLAYYVIDNNFFDTKAA